MSKQLLLHPSCCRVHRQALLRQTQGAQACHVSPYHSQVSIHPGKKSNASCVCRCFVVLVVCMCVYTHACASVCHPDINIRFLPQLFSAPQFWITRSLIEPGVHGMVSQRTQGSYCLQLPNAGIIDTLLCQAGGLNSGPHNQIATMSLMELKIFLCAFWAFVPNTAGIG